MGPFKKVEEPNLDVTISSHIILVLQKMIISNIFTKSDPPIPTLTTSVIAFPEYPFQAPDTTLPQKSSMCFNTALTLGRKSVKQSKIYQCNNLSVNNKS